MVSPAAEPPEGRDSGSPAAAAPLVRRFWRHDPPELDLTDPENPRVTRGGMWPSQRRTWELTNFVKLFIGGYGAGKTLLGGKRIISNALINSGPTPELAVLNLICSPTLEMARETTISTVTALLDGKRRRLGAEEFDWTYHKTEHVWTVRHRNRWGRIKQVSGEDPDRLKGPNVGSVWMDEPGSQKKQVFIELHARVRDPRARRREIFGTGTPEELNWLYDLCEGMGDDEFSDIDVGVVFASTRENLALGPSYVKRLEGVLSARAVQALVDGKFVSLATGLVYYAYDSTENVFSLERPPGVELGVGMDFNVNPMAAVVFWRNGSHLHFFDEIELPNADTQFMCAELHARGYHRDGLRAIYPDASGNARHTAAPGGKSDFHYIREAGFTIDAPQANPPRRDRFNSVNGKLKPKDGKLSLSIEPRCKKLRKYLAQYSHEKLNEQKGMSHLLDAFGYPISRLFPVDAEMARALRLKGYAA